MITSLLICIEPTREPFRYRLLGEAVLYVDETCKHTITSFLVDQRLWEFCKDCALLKERFISSCWEIYQDGWIQHWPLYHSIITVRDSLSPAALQCNHINLYPFGR